MSALAVFPSFGARHEPVPPLEVTIAKVKSRWMLAFVDGGDVTPSAPAEMIEEIPLISYASDYHARVSVWGYAKLWLSQGLTVIYRSDMETCA